MAVYKTDPNLIALWLLNETSGTRYDETPNHNDLTDYNTVGYSSDAKEGDYAADFERGNAECLYIIDADQTGLAITGDITICCWAKPESLTASEGHCLVTRYTTSDNNRAYLLWLDNESGVYYPVLNLSSVGTDYSRFYADTAVSAGSWVHLAAVYNGIDVRLYTNGALDCTPTPYTSGIYNATSQVRLGRHLSNTWAYDGLMDEVAIFNRALSATEISDIYDYGFSETAKRLRIIEKY